MKRLVLLLLLLGCGHTHHAPPPHVHKIKWLISQGAERDSTTTWFIYYACCECGATMEMNRAMMDLLLNEQGVTLTTEVPR